ncbi:1-phosphofructokinase [Vagococcus acidifermentans]|uniref:Tagatose-6-phosphate kinase n=1 Tax=Vagococcus acidifermentans TaxID=564710 RepID=A0A430ASZ0_9ENTE|nr:1-phosphofructokinase [Vagococcus acidifermentans]RSU11167.1 1-phosphofructokinase [Vagococcus acidifermentans]
MIYTVTLNPSIDYIVHVDHLKIGTLNRMSSELKFPGGKGINVSRILKRIQTPSVALGFLGGFTGRFILDWLKAEGVLNQFTQIAADTRINIKLKAESETEINGVGPHISDKEIQNLKAELDTIQPSDIVVLSGSLPGNLPDGFYQELIQLIHKQGAEFVIDTTGDALQQSLSSRPLLVKPNKEELGELYQTTFDSIEELLPYGQQLLAEGAQHAIISMASEGALLFTDDGVYQSNVLMHPLKNSVGAGDSMIAGFIGNYARSKDAVEAFKWGVACGSATAFSDDLASGELIRTLLSEVHIRQIS